MSNQRLPPAPYVQPYRYASPSIPMSAIRRFARRIAERFHPVKIILFGSYAYGTPHNESDVDLMVIMTTRNAIDQAIRIALAFARPFSVDLHVRTPCQIQQGLKDSEDRDWFLYEVMTRGKVLCEAPSRALRPAIEARREEQGAVGPEDIEGVVAVKISDVERV